jgi:hypothetical protein
MEMASSLNEKRNPNFSPRKAKESVLFVGVAGVALLHQLLAPLDRVCMLSIDPFDSPRDNTQRPE